MQTFLEAADGIRTHDLLHGKQRVGFQVAPRFPCKGERALPRRWRSPPAPAELCAQRGPAEEGRAEGEDGVYADG
jgi:hypothetical protein